MPLKPHTIMENRFFITEVYVPSGSRTIEHQLADHVRPYIDHVLSESALTRLAQDVTDYQNNIVKENRRLRPVDIRLDLDSGGGYLPYFFYMGQVSVSLRYVKGELI